MPEAAPVAETSSLKTATKSPWTSALWWVMLVSSAGVVAYATRFFVAAPATGHFAQYILPLRLHIAGGMGALLAGPWQFSRRLRTRALNVHRWLGRLYLLSVGLGSIAGMAMAMVSMEGLATHLGFGILALLWFMTALQAYRVIRRGEIEVHQRWMMRNFALSLAAVTLRNEFPLMLFALHWSFHASYIMVSWLCWVPNLIVAEWMVRRRRKIITSLAYQKAERSL